MGTKIKLRNKNNKSILERLKWLLKPITKLRTKLLDLSGDIFIPEKNLS